MAAAARPQEASSSISRCTYHVFLSFRGEDTRTNFTDHLYGALRQAGIHTFLDDDGIERGERIDAELQKAIKESKISIVVFSKDYASSRWCLGELVMIMERRRTCGHTVVPVFYNVDPSQVRKQTGSFAEAFARHEKRFKEEMDQVEGWRAALREVADLGGMVLDKRHEFQFIQDIVREIRERLYRPLLNVAPHLVGIDSRVKDINRWLQDGSSDVGIATIFGIGGIGKTTIAKIVYNLNFDRFQGRSFLANVKETSKKANGLVRLQNQLLSDLLNKNVNKVYSVDEGITKIKNVICYRKVLIVLDDVEQSNQLDTIIGMHEWLYPGSKIIITTRHARLLRAHQVCVKFEVKELDDNESLQLFSWHAFGQSHPTEGYMKCSRKVADRCGGLPLGLKVLGSSLCGRSIDVWESALQKPEAMIQEVLKINYDSLEDDHDKNLFLDIACFFVGEDKDYAIAILDACDFFTTPGIQNLIDRCLLTVEGNKLMMPQLLQDMGREIIRQESADDPGKRSRLWHHKDAFTVLKEKTGTQTVKGLIFDLRRSMEDKHGRTIISGNSAKRYHDEDYLDKSTIGNCSKRRRLSFFSWKPTNGSSENLCSLSTEVDLETKAFMKMHKLKLLQLNYVKLKGDYEDFSKNLVWLCWHGFPLESLPTNFYLEKLVALDMRHSSLKHVWKGTRFLAELKFLNLSHSHGLVGTPDFSGVPNLERLILEDCINLVKVDESVVNLDRLVVLNLEDCKNLRKLPRNIWMLKSLEDLNLSGCSKLDELPKELRKMESLKVLHVDGVSINQLHADTSDTDKLILLPTTSWHSTLWSWLSLTKNPHSTSFSLAFLPNSLVSLSLRNCNLSDDAISYGLASLPSLRNLNLSENPFHSLPKSIKGLTMLDTLKLMNCRELKLIPEFPNSLKHVTLYHVTFPRLMILGCDKLVEIGGLFKLEPLENADVTVLKNLGLSNLESLRSIEVDIISDMYSSAKRTPVQVLHECDIVSVFLPGSEIPRCFNLQSAGSLISFDVPTLVGHKICGLNLCMIYALDMEYGWTSHYDCAIISNKTRRVRWSYTPICYAIPGAKEDMLWLSHWKTGDQLEGGDHIDVSMVFSYRVKMCGISLVYEPEDKNTQSNTDVTVRSAFPWYQTLTLTKAGADAYFRCHHSFSFYLCKVLSNQKYYHNTYTKDHMELDTCFICEDKLTEERKKIVYYIQGNEKVCPKQVDTKEALDRHSPSKYNRFEEEIKISAVENPIESQKEALVTAATNVPSQVMAGISKHDEAPSTPQCALSAMGEACSRGDITAIHQILVRSPYRDTGVSEMSDMLETMLRHGDHAFCKQDFETAIDYYSQFIDAMVSPVIFARRSLCYLFCDQLDDALRDAMQAQCVYPKWPTAFYLQSVALAKLGMQKAAGGLLIEAARLEEKSQQEVLKGGKAKISAVDGRIKPEIMQAQEAESDALLVQSAGSQMSLMSAVEDTEMIPEASGQQGSKATLPRLESEIVQIEEMHAQSHPSSALG